MIALERQVWRCLWVSDHPEERPRSLRRMAAAPPGGFVLFARHWPELAAGIAAIHDLGNQTDGRVRIAIDEEGGPVRRMPPPFPAFPAASVWAGRRPAELRQAARALGQRLAACGISVDFAPVADLELDAEHPALRGRCYGRDPDAAAARVAAMTTGLQDAGLAACAKHFPGHGSIGTDSHLQLDELTRSRNELEIADWVPFRAAIEAGVACIMAAHLRWAGLPGSPLSTTSAELVHLLRRDLGFDGLLLTDDLEMGAIANRWSPAEIAVEAIGAGYDAVLLCHSFGVAEEVAEALTRAAERSPALRRRLGEAESRLDRLPAWQAPLVDAVRVAGAPADPTWLA